jgi:hypothetical protein
VPANEDRRYLQRADFDIAAGVCVERTIVRLGLLAFLGRRPDNRFMQVVRRRVLAIAFSIVLLGSLSSAGSGRAATDPRATVVVITSGVLPEAERLGSRDYGYADYALVLRNRSLAKDALDVTVEVEGVDGDGRSMTDSYTTVTLIPAGADFVISGALIWSGSAELAGIETEVHVGQSAPRGRRLPTVKHVSMTSSGRVLGSFTNPYKKPLPASATIYGVVLDSRGRIVATGYGLTDAVARPGAIVAFDILAASTTAQRDVVTSAKVSVDPCGYLVFTRVCPVPGAQR